MTDNVLVVRQAWRREWRGILMLVVLAFMFGSIDLVLSYARAPLAVIENLFQHRINFAPIVEIAIAFLFVVTVIQVFFRHYRHKYQFSKEGVSHIIGILGREERPLSYKSMTLATKKQGISEFIFGIGNIFLHSSGTDTADVVIQGISGPKAILDRVQNGMRVAHESA